jgi:hypothetical protein
MSLTSLRWSQKRLLRKEAAEKKEVDVTRNQATEMGDGARTHDIDEWKEVILRRAMMTLGGGAP